MAILTGLSLLWIGVGAGKPFAKGVIDLNSPEIADVARSANLALLLKGRIGVLTRGDIIKRSEEKLMPLGRTTELHGQNARHVRTRQAGSGIESDGP